MKHLENHIGGRLVPAQQGGRLEDLDPSTGQVVATIPRSGPADVDLAVRAAKRAQPGWAAVGLEERCAVLDRIADRIEADLEHLSLLETQDTGKPITTSRTIDIPRAVRNFRFFAEFARTEDLPTHRMDTGTNHTLRQPLGVVGLITPWNLPLYLLTWKVAPALAMGNAVVAKPSEMTPQTADALATIVGGAGLPPGVLNVVHGLGPEAGAALTTHPDVAALSFTGGTATGRQVAAGAAPSFKKLSLELGGKNPGIVFADCDLEHTAEGVARAAFTNQGQVCLCSSRLLVQESVYDRFLEAFVPIVEGLVVGDPMLSETRLGALVSPAHRDQVAGYVDAARADGAEVLCGGAAPELGEALEGGAFYAPTVLAGLPPGHKCLREEIFGPVATVQSFVDEDDAVRMANDSRYGLAATVWTGDAERAMRVSAALQTGMVWVNDWLVRDLRVPFGGVKDSGVGREGGHYSLDFFSEVRNVYVAK